MRRPLRAIAYLLVLSLVIGAAAAQVRSRAATQAAPAEKATKWDEGQKDLLTSLEADPPKDAQTKDEPIYVTVLSFIFKLAIVLALAYATICALKRFTGLRNVIGGSRRRIRIVENAALGTNRSLHLVEVECKRLLVASTPNQINLLAVLNPPALNSIQGNSGQDDAEAMPEADTAQSTEAGFSDQLSAFMGAGPDAGDSAKTVAQTIRGSSTFLQEKILQLGRLRRKLRDG